MDPETSVGTASTLFEDVQTAYRLIAEQYACRRYPPDRASEYISALASSLEGQVSESVLLIVQAFAFHLGHGGHSKFIKQAMLIRAANGYTLREVVWFAPPGRAGYDPPVSNTGVTSPTTDKGGTAL